jgi:hypothetical protein
VTVKGSIVETAGRYACLAMCPLRCTTEREE